MYHAPTTPGKCNVLVAEDNPGNRALTLAVLGMIDDCEVTVVNNGVAAVELCQQGDFQLVLMDYHMPDMNGGDAARAIRAWEATQGRTPVCIVALTASAMPTELERCVEAGMNEVITKPIDVFKLKDLVARACQQYLHPESAVAQK